MTNELQEEISRIDSIWTRLREKHADQGPWLFGEFSIADCMFAPVVSRFSTYNPVVSATSQKYMTTVLKHPKIQLWLEQAKKEIEIIGSEEAGL